MNSVISQSDYIDAAVSSVPRVSRLAGHGNVVHAQVFLRPRTLSTCVPGVDVQHLAHLERLANGDHHARCDGLARYAGDKGGLTGIAGGPDRVYSSLGSFPS